MPERVSVVLAAAGLPAITAQAWRQLCGLQRFALCKLTARGQQRNLPVALAEFGLITYAA